MPPKGRKNEAKETKSTKDGKELKRERTDEELKASPTFREQFYREVYNRADPKERKSIEIAHQNSLQNPSVDFDGFVLEFFELEWFLEDYEEIFSATKERIKTLAPVKREEAPVKLEPQIEAGEYITPSYMRNPSHEYPQYYTPPYTQPTGPIYNQMKPMGANIDPYASFSQPAYPSSQPQQLSQLQPAYTQPPTMMTSQLPNPKAPQMSVPMQGQIPSQMIGQIPTHMPPSVGAHPQVQIPPQISQHIQHQVQPQSQPQSQPVQTVQTAMPGVNRGVSEKEDRTVPTKDQFQTTTEFETNAQLRQKLNNVVPLNSHLMINSMNKQNKKATDGFYHGLYMSITDYVRNLLDELKNVCEMDLDSGDLKNYMKTGGGNETEGESKPVLMGGMEESEHKAPKPYQYLVKFSSIQEDQKQIDKLDDREQKDIEDKYTLSKDDDEEKATKKVKKDFTEEDEIIKFLFKTKKDKGQDNENMTKKIQETNLTISNLTSRTYSQPKAMHMQDSIQREASGKGRKSTASQKRVTMKHLIYYLETNPLYKRTPLLHKAYLK